MEEKVKANLSRLLPQYGINDIDIDVKDGGNNQCLVTFKSKDNDVHDKIMGLRFIKEYFENDARDENNFLIMIYSPFTSKKYVSRINLKSKREASNGAERSL